MCIILCGSKVTYLIMSGLAAGLLHLPQQYLCMTTALMAIVFQAFLIQGKLTGYQQFSLFWIPFGSGSKEQETHEPINVLSIVILQ